MYKTKNFFIAFSPGQSGNGGVYSVLAIKTPAPLYEEIAPISRHARK
jgi:hypothetical protein